MRPRTLLFLAAVVGALLGLIFFAEDRVASTDERAATSKKLVNVKPEELVALEIEWQGSRVRFERAAIVQPKKDGAADGAALVPELPEAEPARPWRIVEPFAYLADGAAVDRLVSELASLAVERDVEGAVRKDLGLEPPRGSVSFKTPTAEGRVEIGGSVPASHAVVVAASGRSLPAVTADDFLEDLARPPGEWRSREVVTVQAAAIDRVTITPVAGEALVFTRSGETLRLESPVADLADRELADGLIADLRGLRMETFLDPPLAGEIERALAESTSAGVIELTIAGRPETMRIEIGGERTPGKRVWRAGSQVFESASKLSLVVARPALEWRSRNWTRFENWRIEKVRVEEAAGAFELVRSDGEWLRDGKKIPFTAASDLLYALTAAKADVLVESPAPEAAGTPRPTLTLTLSDADGNEEMLTLHPGSPQGVPARTRGRGVTLMLAPGLVDDLDAKISAVRAAEPIAD